jgi:hypothetical protein
VSEDDIIALEKRYYHLRARAQAAVADSAHSYASGPLTPAGLLSLASPPLPPSLVGPFCRRMDCNADGMLDLRDLTVVRPDSCWW